MVLLSSSGTGGISAKLANGSGSIQLLSGFPYPQFIGVTISGWEKRHSENSGWSTLTQEVGAFTPYDGADFRQS
jgi:hypothetical protein